GARLALLLQLHHRVHVLGVERQVPRLPVELGARQLRGRDALVAVLELELLHQGLELVADDRPVREPERQALADELVDRDVVELATELLVVALERLAVRLDVRLELLLRLERPRVDRSEEPTSELQSRENLVCRLLL